MSNGTHAHAMRVHGRKQKANRRILILPVIMAAAVACIMAMSSAFAGGGRTTASNGMLDASAEAVWAATGTDACAAGEAGAAVLTLGVRGSEGLASLGCETVLVSYVLPDSLLIDDSALDASVIVADDPAGEGVLGSALMGAECSDAEGNAFTAYSDLTPQQAARLALVPEPGEGADSPCTLVQFRVAAADLAGASAEVSVPLMLSDMSLAEGASSLPAGADGAILPGAMAVVAADAEGGALSTLSCDAPVLTLAAPEAEEPEEPEPADESAEPDPAADEAAEPEESSEPADEAASEGEPADEADPAPEPASGQPADEAAPAEHGREGDGCCEPDDADDPLGPEQLEGIEDRLVTDPETDVSYDPETGLVADPETGGIVDPETGEVVVPAKQEPSEPGIGFIVDAAVAELAPQGEGALEPQEESEEGSQISTALKAALGRTMMLLGAGPNIASGTSGTCSWVIDSDGKLTISPTSGTSGTLGSFTASTGSTAAPWLANAADITSVYIAPGVKAGSSLSYAFSGCKNMVAADVHNLDLSGCTAINYLFYNDSSLKTVNTIGWNTSNVTNMSGTFWWCSELVSVDVSGWNTSNVTNASNLFAFCRKLVDLGSNSATGAKNVSNWNTSKMTSMSQMFSDCNALEELDVSGFDTARVTSFSSMFSGCHKLDTIDVSNFETAAATNLTGMFNGCNSVKVLDVSRFNTSKVKNMNVMFKDCYELEELDVSGFDTSKVTNMTAMFQNCSSLHTLDLSNFNSQSLAYAELYPGTGVYSGGLPQMFAGVGSRYFDGPLITLGPAFQFSDSQAMRPSDASVAETALTYPRLVSADLSASTDAEIIAKQQAAAASGVPQGYVMGYKVLFDANGGTFADGTSEKELWFRQGSKISANARTVGAVSKTGDTLLGWDTEVNNAATRVAPAELPWETEKEYCAYGAASFAEPYITLYADWSSGEVVLDTGTAEGALLYNVVVNDSDESDAPAKTFTYTISNATSAAPLPSSQPTSVTSGSDTYLVDMGELAFRAPGLYRYVITETEAGSEDGGWIFNSTTKFADVKVDKTDSGLVITSVTPTSFTNIYEGGKYTADIDEDDLSDEVQQNWQSGELTSGSRSGDVLSKGAAWTDQANGEAQITLSYNTPSHDASNTAVYMFTNCDAHGFTRDIAADNIEFLIANYEKADVICACSAYDSGLSKVSHTFYSDSTDAEINAYLDTVMMTHPCHLGAVAFLPYLDEYLGVDSNGIAQKNDPAAIYLSFDGSRGVFSDNAENDKNFMAILYAVYGNSFDLSARSYYLPQSVSDDTMRYLANKQADGGYYLLLADEEVMAQRPTESYDYVNVYNGKSPNLAYLNFSLVSPTAYVNNSDDIVDAIEDLYDAPAGSSIPLHTFTPGGVDAPLNKFTYSKSLYELDITIAIGTDLELVDVIDPRFELVDTGAVTLEFCDGTAVPSDAYTVSTEVLTEGGVKTGTKVTIRLRADAMNPLYTMPITARINVALPEGADGYFYDEATDGFDETNVGDATADAYNVMVDSSGNITTSDTPIASLAVESPLLYKGEDKPVPPVKQIFEQGKTENIDGETIYTGKTYTYSISWENVSSKAKTATFTDVVPDGVTFVSASTGGVYDSAANTVTWSGVSVAAGATATVTFDVTVDDDAPGREIENEAVVNDGKVDLESNETENPVKNTPLSLPFPTTGKGGFEIVLAAGVALLLAASFCAWRIRRSWR